MASGNERAVMKGEATLRQRYDSVRSRIAEAALRSGRRPEDVVLVAVTKHASIDEVRELMGCGHADFGESRVQALLQRSAQIEEYLQRARELSPRDGGRAGSVRWHMIGHVQRNKVRRVIDAARLIHSVDSLRLAEEIQTAAGLRDEPVEILVQVNVSGEKSKHGVAPPAAGHLIDQIDTMLSLRARGLMCMAPLVENPRDAAEVFHRCRELFEDIRTAGGPAGRDRFNILSMGMSNDYEVAVECGANVVRVGSAIFGQGQAAAAAREE